jgi:hypothetical protein
LSAPSSPSSLGATSPDLHGSFDGGGSNFLGHNITHSASSRWTKGRKEAKEEGKGRKEAKEGNKGKKQREEATEGRNEAKEGSKEAKEWRDDGMKRRKKQQKNIRKGRLICRLIYIEI